MLMCIAARSRSTDTGAGEMDRKTFRSRTWGVYTTLLQLASAFAFGIMPLAPGPLGENIAFTLIALVSLAGAVRSSLMRVVVSGNRVTIHGYLGNQQLEMLAVSPEIIDDKVLASVWAPVVTTSEGEQESLSLLSGYGRSQTPNKRVARVCAEMNRMAQEAQSR